VDKEAAGRFIKHAISSVQWKKTAAEEAQEEEQPEASTSSSARVPVKVTSKMLERAEYEKRLKEKAAAGEESEEEDLQVFNEDGEDSMDVDGAAPAAAQNQRKRQRAALDPFAGTFIYASTTGLPMRIFTHSLSRIW
jgi:exosome complex protein LRP1